MVKRIAISTVLLLALGLAASAAAITTAPHAGAPKLDSAVKLHPKHPKHVIRVTSVPEPGSLLLFGVVSVAGAGALKRKV